MRTARWIGAAIVAEIVVGVVAVHFLQPPAPVTVNQAVTNFRKHLIETSAATSATKRRQAAKASVPSPAVAQPRKVVAHVAATRRAKAPAPGLAPAQQGVYVYDTSGQEQIDRPNKATHSYPARTTMTVSGSACDARLSWEPIQGRNMEIGGCYDNGSFRVSSMATTQTFFGYRTRSVYSCADEGIAMPVEPKAGSSWSFACEAAKTHAGVKVSVVGAESRTVGATDIATWHIRFDIALSGATRGTEVVDFWFASTNALPIKLTSTTDVNEDTSFGAVHYTEHYALALAELKPRT